MNVKKSVIRNEKKISDYVFDRGAKKQYENVCVCVAY